MNRVINALFALVISLAFALFVLALTVHAEETKAMRALRQTAVMVNGLGCSGSGSIVEGKSGRHFLVTNNHVCNCAAYKGRVYATFEGGGLVRAIIVKKSWPYDLCAARVDRSYPALKLAPKLDPRSELNTRGYPEGRLTESHGTLGEDTDWFWTAPLDEVGNCPTNSQKLYGLNGALAGCRIHFTSTTSSLYGRPGSSGSAVVNDEGQLVGVVSSFNPDDDNYDAGQTTFEQTKSFVESL